MSKVILSLLSVIQSETYFKSNRTHPEYIINSTLILYNFLSPCITCLVLFLHPILPPLSFFIALAVPYITSTILFPHIVLVYYIPIPYPYPFCALYPLPILLAHSVFCSYHFHPYLILFLQKL